MNIQVAVLCDADDGREPETQSPRGVDTIITPQTPSRASPMLHRSARDVRDQDEGEHSFVSILLMADAADHAGASIFPCRSFCR